MKENGIRAGRRAVVTGGPGGGMGTEGGNPVRSETMNEAVELDSRLRSIWARHPHFTVVEHDTSFFRKIGRGLETLSETIRKLPP